MDKIAGRQQFRYWLLAFLVCFAPAHFLRAETLPIELNQKAWYALQGFQKGFVEKCPPALEARKITKFPIVLNKVFHVPAGEAFHHYTLCVKVALQAEDLQATLGLHLPWIGEAWELYVNGKRIRNELPLDAKGDLIARRMFRHITIPLSGNIVHEGENTFVFHIAGYSPPTTLESNTNLGLVFAKGYTIDRLDRLQEKYAGYFRVIQISIFAFFGLYHLIFFVYRRQDRYNLYFGLFLLFMSGNVLMGHFFTKTLYNDTGTINRIKYMCQAFSAPMIIMFITEYFLAKEPTSLLRTMAFAISRALLFFFSGIGIAFLLLPFAYTEVNLWLFQKSLIPLLLTGLVLMLVFIYKKKSDAYIMGFGLLLLIGSTAWDLLTPEEGFLLSPVGTLACIFALVFMLARRFLKVNQESDRLNRKLYSQRNSFQKFVPFQVLELLRKTDITEIDLGDSSERKMSVLFSDIRSYTSLSESMTVEENFRFLNSYMRRMEPSIKRNHGFVDKYIGDAILALFPEAKTFHSSADRAVQAAVDLQREIEIFNGHRKNSNYAPIRVGIAINTGTVMLGTVGSSNRMDTTVIGNVVNLASRLESLNKLYDTSILVSGFTLESLENGHFASREIDAVRVVGKKESVVIHEIFESDPPDLKEKKERSKKDLMQALVLYKLRDFSEAKGLFQKIAEYFPEDRVVQLYLERCKKYLIEPPPEDWQGVVELLHK